MVAYCPGCDSEVTFKKRPYQGMSVVCKNCDEELVVVSLNPIELDWAYSDDDDEEFEALD